ncbi:anti-sigma factor family protein [Streptomyces litchfieldiae]|uniref:Zinc-finger domain-containing protein n=1 Tax=Streptomyces litchfieldiae TaxID=3075543 RepID=A0ABU2MKL7_9ACTN|nr:hypothetical protein [Streptomyces sp. DSM 44938]MDT0342153.1 hypothetical protein [Streptomyces sp. DSM 44938]
MNDTHPEPAEIAALDEDLLPPADAARVHDHLAWCDACARVQVELAALTQALGDLPDPGPIPADIAARIDLALAEGAAADAVSRETADAGRETETAAYGAVSVAPPATRTPASDLVLLRQRRERRHRRLQMGLAAVGAVVVLGVGVSIIQSGGGMSAGDESGGELEASVNDQGQGELSGPSDELETRVRELLAEAQDTGPLVAEGSEGATPEESQSSPSVSAQPEVPACVEETIGRREAPLAADEEDYAGVDAYLVVFPHEADPEQIDAYVVSASCVTGSPSTAGEILVQESYPRD